MGQETKAGRRSILMGGEFGNRHCCLHIEMCKSIKRKNENHDGVNLISFKIQAKSQKKGTLLRTFSHRPTNNEPDDKMTRILSRAKIPAREPTEKAAEGLEMVQSIVQRLQRER